MRTSSPNGQGGPAPDRDPKKALRVEALRRRAAASAAKPGAGQALFGQFAGLGPRAKPRPGDWVAGYAPIRDEIDPGPLLLALEAEGARVALPRTGPDGLRFHRRDPGVAMRVGAFGVLEPPPEAPIVRPRFVLLPCLAFDARGHRLGYGKGYYDRALEALRREAECVAVLLAFAAQEVERLPDEEHDAAADAVVTELGARWCVEPGKGDG